MAVSEICRNGIRIRLLQDEERLFLQVLSEEEPVNSKKGIMPCDPDVLCATLRGMTYQLASETSYCVLRRRGNDISVDCQEGEQKKHCDIPVDEFSRIVAPVMPPRLRAVLL